MKRWWLDREGGKPNARVRSASARQKAKRHFSQMDAKRDKDSSLKTRHRLLKAFALATICHVLILSGIKELPHASEGRRGASQGPVSVVFLNPNKNKAASTKERAEKKKAVKEDRKEEMPKGQVVALPPDHNAVRPDRADYLSETHHKVANETRSRFATNDADAAAAHRLQMGVRQKSLSKVGTMSFNW